MKQTLMHLSLVTLFATTLALGLVPNLQAEEDRSCTNATLRGPYVLKGAVWNLTLQQHGASLGVVTLDGQGRISGAVTGVGVDGVNHRTVSGTYTVNPDCTGSALIEEGPPLDLVILDGGNEVEGIDTGTHPPNLRFVTVTLKKQFPRHRDEEDD